MDGFFKLIEFASQQGHRVIEDAVIFVLISFLSSVLILFHS